MQLAVLDSDYRMETLIENRTSLIWTERQIAAGEFELHTGEIEETMDKMPLDSLVTVLDSDEVMIVEDHLITTNEDGIDELKVTGRSFETILESRASAEDATDKIPNEWQIKGKSRGAVARAAIRQQIISGVCSIRDVYPNVEVFWYPLGSESSLPDRQFSLKLGDLYSSVTDLLTSDSLGIRIRRVLQTSGGDPPQIRIEIYEARDFSIENRPDQLVFSTSAGHFDTQSYLFSTRDKKNVAYIYSPTDTMRIAADGHSTAEYSGFDRRVIVIDASDITKAKSGYTVDELLTSRAQSELKKHQGRGIFSGTLSLNIPYKFKRDYNLGDRVSLHARYGIKADMRITEYVRNEDASGETGYPTLTQI